MPAKGRSSSTGRFRRPSHRLCAESCPMTPTDEKGYPANPKSPSPDRFLLDSRGSLRLNVVRASASVRTTLVVGVVLLGLVGCGGNGGGDGGSDSAASSPGAKVFADPGCGNCHTMEAADATGTTGPSLDDLKPEKARVARQVQNGGVGMPSFSDKLTDEQIDQVAEFVSNETRKATGGGSVAAGFKPDDTKVEDCAEDDFQCFEQAFANIAYNDGPKAALDRFDEDIKTPGPDRARLSPHRSRDWRRRALTLRRQRRSGLRRRPRKLHVGLLPRDPRAGVPRHPPGPTRGRLAQVLFRPGDPEDPVHRVPVRPRPRPRPDDLLGVRPCRPR